MADRPPHIVIRYAEAARPLSVTFAVEPHPKTVGAILATFCAKHRKKYGPLGLRAEAVVLKDEEGAELFEHGFADPPADAYWLACPRTSSVARSHKIEIPVLDRVAVQLAHAPAYRRAVLEAGPPAPVPTLATFGKYVAARDLGSAPVFSGADARANAVRSALINLATEVVEGATGHALLRPETGAVSAKVLRRARAVTKATRPTSKNAKPARVAALLAVYVPADGDLGAALAGVDSALRQAVPADAVYVAYAAATPHLLAACAGALARRPGVRAIALKRPPARIQEQFAPLARCLAEDRRDGADWWCLLGTGPSVWHPRRVAAYRDAAFGDRDPRVACLICDVGAADRLVLAAEGLVAAAEPAPPPRDAAAVDAFIRARHVQDSRKRTMPAYMMRADHFVPFFDVGLEAAARHPKFSELGVVTHFCLGTHRQCFKPRAPFADNWLLYEPTEADTSARLAGSQRAPTAAEAATEAAELAALTARFPKAKPRAIRASLAKRRHLLDMYVAAFAFTPADIRADTFLALGAAAVRDYFKAENAGYPKALVNALCTGRSLDGLLVLARDADVPLQLRGVPRPEPDKPDNGRAKNRRAAARAAAAAAA